MSDTGGQAATPIPKGTVVRLIRASTVDGRRRAGGLEITVGTYFDTEGTHPYYTGSTRHGINDMIFHAEDVEIVRSAPTRADGTPPSLVDLERAIIDAMGHSRDADLQVRVIGSQGGTITVTASNAEGVSYEFEVAISNIHSVAA
ncbi:hypothetical protein GCM10025867_50760 (plasmid) [Frondihabitans sucicola]|uniref:Uncharacterized protein n=1 Tax=Frondihabitans sucicola TaxID=1268041 RepID=A0ABM8GWJ3_9MICO|nr:hypothetical protein [Frondihabitans sucicola]BDZ52835.1 hypothetical protein GCM10025867_50760 [Frondihabitans sucicola]